MIAALTAGSMVAAARSSVDMADAAAKLLSSLTPEQRQQAHVRVRVGRTVALALHPDRRCFRAKACSSGR